MEPDPNRIRVPVGCSQAHPTLQNLPKQAAPTSYVPVMVRHGVLYLSRILTALKRRVIAHSLHRRTLRLSEMKAHFPNANVHVNHLGGLLELRF